MLCRDGHVSCALYSFSCLLRALSEERHKPIDHCDFRLAPGLYSHCSSPLSRCLQGARCVSTDGERHRMCMWTSGIILQNHVATSANLCVCICTYIALYSYVCFSDVVMFLGCCIQTQSPWSCWLIVQTRLQCLSNPEHDHVRLVKDHTASQVVL